MSRTNQIIIHDDYAEIILTRYNAIVGHVLIDLEDLGIVKDYYWFLTGDGYASTKEGYNYKRLHQLIMNAPKGMVVDHINRDKLDDRRSNLRICTTKENNYNKGPKPNQEFKGVTPCKYKASITYEGVTYNLGTFKTKEEAARVYDKKAIELYGEFAYINFPREDYTHLLEIKDDMLIQDIPNEEDYIMFYTDNEPVDYEHILFDTDGEPIDYDNII